MFHLFFPGDLPGFLLVLLSFQLLISTTIKTTRVSVTEVGVAGWAWSTRSV